jgi:ribosome-associated protein
MNAPADPSSAAQPPTPVAVQLPITLGQFLKAAGLAATGGEAKYLVLSGRVMVNGEVEVRRGRHLSFGDSIATPDGGSVLVSPDTHGG